MIYGTTTTPIGINSYRYDTTQNKLYFSYNGTNWSEVSLDMSGIYVNNGIIYIPINDNGTNKLVKMGG